MSAKTMINGVNHIYENGEWVNAETKEVYKSPGLSFGSAFEEVKKGRSMRLPQWSEDVLIKAQFPDENSKMTAPYLYVESRFGKVPWKETMIELFSDRWEVV